MFKIENTTISITRGDEAVIELSIPEYTFQSGDHVELRVYSKGALNSLPLITVVKEVELESQTVDITLTPEDTRIGEPLNTPTTYWYEIELNNKYTVIGYDEDGAKELILYPEGVEEDDVNS